MEIIEQCIKKSQKRKVRKAHANGWRFRINASKQGVTRLVELLDETRRARLAKGYDDYDYYYVPYLDRKVIGNLLDRKIATIFCAEKDDIIHSIELVAIYANRAFGLLMATDETGYSGAAGPFLLYNVMRHLHHEGVGSFNLGGAPRDSSAASLVRFKRAFGAKEYQGTSGSTVGLQGSGFARVLRASLRNCRSTKRRVEKFFVR
jgi:CelD/BcsL family acetyltransferase involved in cellulose biosynthesis